MSEQSVNTEHPTDRLPEYVRGVAPDGRAIERHLEQCETCTLEVEMLRALAAPVDELSDVERLRTYRAFEARRTALRPARPGSMWLRASWRAAAGVALVLTSIGVWQVVQTGRAGEWNPDAAIEGFAEDLADLELSDGELRMALGVGLVDDPTLDVPWDAGDVDGLDLPWEAGR